MVNYVFILTFFLLPWSVFAETKLTADIDQSQYFTENVPIKVTIMVTHSPAEKVDENSFTLKNVKLTVEHVQDVPVGSTEVISIYKFELPGKPKGLHVLDEISAKVGTTKYTTVASTFEVGGGRAPPPINQAVPAAPAYSPRAAQQAPTKPASLRLEQQVEAPDPFYPGKRGRLIYRYIYSGDIELSKESLPLMKADNFLKIGEEEVKDFEQDGFSIREISQIIQATKPGTFSYEGAVVEGRAYSVDSSGRRSYEPTSLHAETAPLKIEVKPLPSKDKPPSFTGAVGKYTFQVRLDSPKEVSVGDKLNVVISIGGPQDTLANVLLPELCCLPGMSGLFKLSDLPPSSVIKDSVKQFSVEMRPLSANVREIPSLEFSYFDPESQQFKTLRSEPIPIIVREIPVSEPKPVSVPRDETPPKPIPPNAIEIGANYPLTESDLNNRLFGGWSVYWLIPFGVALTLFQISWRKTLLNRKEEIKPVTSADIFKEAMAEKPDSPGFYQKINRAFMLRLAERGDISSADTTPDQLPENGVAGEVKQYLLALEADRFSGRGKRIDGKQATALFEKLRMQT